MIRKDIFLGFFIGLLANIIGMLIYILIFSEAPMGQTITESIEKDFMGTLITAGAILNFLPFFIFLKKEHPNRARGVLMATILAALVIAILKVV